MFELDYPFPARTPRTRPPGRRATSGADTLRRLSFAYLLFSSRELHLLRHATKPHDADEVHKTGPVPTEQLQHVPLARP